MALEMLSPEQIQELDSDFLNIDAFFANNVGDDDREGLFTCESSDTRATTARRETHTSIIGLA